MFNIFDTIINKKQIQEVLIGTVETVSPLTVTLLTDDIPLPAISTMGLLGVSEGNRIILLRFGKQLLAIAKVSNNSGASIKVVRKTQTQTVNNNTFVYDNELVALLDANSIYEIEIKLAVSGATNSDFKTRWAVTGGVSQLTTRGCLGPGIGTSDNAATYMRSTNHNLTTSVSYGTDNSTAALIQERFLVAVVATGLIKLEWAQNTKQVTDTSVSNNSYMIIRKLYQ